MNKICGDHTGEAVKELVGILMESSFYFDLTLKERNLLIKAILSS